MFKNALGPVVISLLLVGSTVFVAMTVVIRLADREAISLGQAIAVFATFITGGLVIASGVWLSWFLAR